jgi:hypothetical protein
MRAAVKLLERFDHRTAHFEWNVRPGSRANANRAPRPCGSMAGPGYAMNRYSNFMCSSVLPSLAATEYRFRDGLANRDFRDRCSIVKLCAELP